MMRGKGVITLCHMSPRAASDPDSPLEDPLQVRQLVKSAARDCVVEDRNSVVAFQANTGVEVICLSPP